MGWAIVGVLAVFLGAATVAVMVTSARARRRFKQKRKRLRDSYALRLQKVVAALPSLELPRPALELPSEVNANYQRLHDLLAAQMFREADQETYLLVLKVTGREDKGWIRHTDIDEFPRLDLNTIDRLWLLYSNGRFGFSVQKRLYQQLGGTREYNETIWQRFGDRVGWRVNGNWISYSQLTFHGSAPVGHLPAAGGGLGGACFLVWWAGVMDGICWPARIYRRIQFQQRQITLQLWRSQLGLWQFNSGYFRGNLLQEPFLEHRLS
ncbi:MAG: GUN4 domain-containing protein [Chloroflexaceae bacterium]|nr:GUN4 domain-containing protein [Chloroflexaceae bacterium]